MLRRRFRFALVVALACVGLSAGAFGDEELGRLSHELRQDSDFRVRVQAALYLGKSGDGRALSPLYKALGDSSAAVRAAAAAALMTLGDPAALPVLLKHNGDDNASVRRQVASAIFALKAQKVRDESRRRNARMLVKLDRLHNGTEVSSSQALFTAGQASRNELDRLPGVALLNVSEDVDRAARTHKLPVVLITGSIRKLDAVREGEELLYSAQVDYVVRRMPDQSVVATVTGRASARATPGELKDRKRRDALRTEVLDAAVANAIQRSSPALLAALD